MKKALKFISFALVVIMIVSLFCGCDELDKMRKNVASITSAGDIKIGDDIYKRLPDTDELVINYGESLKYIYVADKEIPLLLVSMMGDSYILDKNNILLEGDTIENYDYDSDSKIPIYCRSDYYEQIKNEIENGFVTSKYCYGYYKISEDDFAGEWVEHILTEEELAAIKTVLLGKGKVIADSMNVLCDYIVTVEGRSEDGYFSEYFCDIYIHEDSYTVVTENEKEIKTFTVPKKFSSIFKNMVNEYVENEQYWNE